jgi:hypothetical protein
MGERGPVVLVFWCACPLFIGLSDFSLNNKCGKVFALLKKLSSVLDHEPAAKPILQIM